MDTKTPRIKSFIFLTIFLLPIMQGCAFFSMNLAPRTQPLSEKTIISGDKEKILMLEISGLISGQDKKGVLNLSKEPNMIARIKESLNKAALDPLVKAILLKINSPGGTVTASDLIYNELMRFKDRTGIKVYACIMDMGTSGAYYISLAADTIIALPTSITGSIGVVIYKVDISGLFKKIGITDDTIKSGDKKDILTPARSLTIEERKLVQNIIDSLYSKFIDNLLRSRVDIDKKRLSDITDGRIFTSDEALTNKLIDKIGYIEDAIEIAREEIGVKNASVVTYYRMGEYQNNIYSTSFNYASESRLNLLNIALSDSLAYSAPMFMYMWRPF